MNIIEITNIIDKLNYEIYDKCNFIEQLCVPLTFEYYTDGYAINFFNYTIWDSEDDIREFDDDKNDWEPLEGYMRKEIRKVIKTISKIEI